ncbi:uncharacterized protein [Chironomus tepperi]|uniref:uncharacterized protein n=1 Tax=Chironomus tepperi TaxID=113505 RepID=UPI00391F6123
MQMLTVILAAVILVIAVDCHGIKRQVVFPNDNNNSGSDENVDERFWGPSWGRTRRPRPARPTRPSTSTTTPATNLNEIPQHIQECIDECPRRTTSEYNPVCGTNQQTYDNQNKLNCASDCGLNVQFRRVGACQPLR